ncbi:hypothetical protein DL766_003522 [Monosporascus sp. MC13-8B]|nr:hypothetical protein DL766_003522 [Monosporascus sp. MC13-8B]
MSTYTVPFIINGEEHHAEKSFELVSPATGEVVHRCGIATEKEVLAAVAAAAAAGRQWRNTTPGQRRDIILKAAELMNEKREQLAPHLINELGASRGWADFNLNTTIDMLKDTAGRISNLNGVVPPSAAPNRTRSVLLPIAAGCTVVLKGSEKSPRVMHAITSLLHEAGLPKGVLNFIATDVASAPSITTSLIAHPQVKKINFTGSSAVGRIIARIAGENLKPVVLELGGKAPAIVWEDADLDIAAEQCTIGSFLFSGQICMSTEKIIVHKKISEAFQKKFVEMIERMFPSKGDAPVLIASEAVDKNKTLLKDATSKGAVLIRGDIDAEEISKTRMRPIVVSKVTPEMDIYKQESFGPSVSLIEVETEEEALRIANDTEYGLNSAVFTENLRTGLRFAKEIETGAVHINNMTVHDEAALPHGGVKASGFGRFNTLFGLEEWVRTKTVTWRN